MENLKPAILPLPAQICKPKQETVERNQVLWF